MPFAAPLDLRPALSSPCTRRGNRRRGEERRRRGVSAARPPRPRGRWTASTTEGADPWPTPHLSAATSLHRCTNCGNVIDTQPVKHLPPSPSCGGPNEWEAVTGGDRVNDPYPESSGQ